MHDQNNISFPLFDSVCAQGSPLTDQDPTQPPPAIKNSNIKSIHRSNSTNAKKLISQKEFRATTTNLIVNYSNNVAATFSLPKRPAFHSNL